MEHSSDAFGIYIHWPFCQSKCPYCDFNSHVADSLDHARWRAALLAELASANAETRNRPVTSVFFGGGTPSLMEPASVAAMLDAIAQHWPLAPDIEVTLEANPGSADANNFAGYRAAGVNRLSIGIQALNDGDLRKLGRRHDRVQALAAIALAQRLFPRFSFDLIYARPGQSPAVWEAELAEALVLGPDHLSVYQLTIEEGTGFFAPFARGELVLPDEEEGAVLFETTRAMLAQAGLPAYETSNHARLGNECRHNLLYWRGQDYLGIGPGAHGRLTTNGQTQAIRRSRAPATWLAQVEAQGHATCETIALSAEERRIELLMMGLRLTEGINRARFSAQAGLELEQALDAGRLADMVAEGFVRCDALGMRCTEAGAQRLNAVLGYLLA